MSDLLTVCPLDYLSVLLIVQYQNKSIEIVQEYTYLGIKLTSNGNFTLAQKNLCVKAILAIFKIRK